MLRAFVCAMVLLACVSTNAEAQPAATGACPPILATRPTVVPPQRYKAGDSVPTFAVDEPLRWLECPAPQPPSGAPVDAKRRAFLFVTVDEKGAVVDVKPRGTIDAEGYFDAAMAAVRRWRSTAPRWKTLPVRSSFAMDVIFGMEAPASPAAESAPQPTSAPKPQTSEPNPPVRIESSEAPSNPPLVVTPTAETKKELSTPVAPAPVPIQPAPEKPATSQPEPAPKVVASESPSPAKIESVPAPPPSATTSAARPAANTSPAPAAPEPAPVRTSSEPKPTLSGPACPQFFILPESQQSRRTYRAGELVPNAYLDQTPNWVECPWPDFSGMPPRTTAVIVMIDDKGAVRDVRPRGQPANAAFERTRKAVLTWRVNPAPRYKSLPVWTSTALDIPNDGRASSSATASIPLPDAPAASALPAGEAQASQEPPYTEEFYYKVKWGFADEFWRLFLKNHWPILRRQIETGRILEVRAEKPMFHGTEDGRWDYRVTIVYRSTAARFASVDTAALERQLYPDQETFKREEQRRFELLLAHWDLPVERVRLP